MTDIDFSSGTHVERRKSLRKRSVPTKKRSFIGSSVVPEIPHLDGKEALKKLWDISTAPAVFTLYDKEVYRHDSDTDTASETEETEITLPVVFTTVFRPDHANLSSVALLEKGRTVYESVLRPDSQDSYCKVEAMTRGQHHSPTREIYRAGRITGTKAHDVFEHEGDNV